MSDAVTRRGVYKDVEKSPYEFRSPYGDIFKFPSKKKMTMYARDVQKELERLDRALYRLDLNELLPEEIVILLYRATYKAFYNKNVR